MGWVAKILSFTRNMRYGVNISDVKVNLGGGENITPEHYANAGDDSYPLLTDYAYGSNIPRTGTGVVTGYLDPINTPKALSGDKRIYSRDSAGAGVSEVWLKNTGEILVSNDNGNITLRADGSIKGDNGSGFFELKTSGTVDINGVTIDPAGNINSPSTIIATTSVSAPLLAAASSLTVSGKEMSGHTHAQGNDSNGDTQVNTTGPV